MIAARQNDCTDEAALAAAVLSERDPFDRSSRGDNFADHADITKAT